MGSIRLSISSGATIRHRIPWLRPLALLIPALVIVGAGLILPMLAMIDISFRTAYPVGDFSLRNYVRLFTDPFLLRATTTTFLMATAVTLVCAVVGYPVAWYLAHSKSRWKHWVFLAVLTPLLVSIVVRTIGWTIVLGNVGLLNNLLLALRLIDEPIRFLGNFWSVVVGMTHVLLPFMVFSISSVLGKIDKSYSEAAATLGANKFQIFFQVILPLSAQGLGAGAVIVFCLTIGAYVTPAWLGRGLVQVLSTNIYQQMVIYVDWPFGTAMSIAVAGIALLVMLVYTVSMRRISIR